MNDYAYLETTSYCNLDCIGCNRRDVISNPKHMSRKTYAKVLDKLSSYPLKEIKLMGMGEPYLNPEFSDICAATREAFPNACIISATNCSYLLSSNFERSLKYLSMVYLSIDGIGNTFEQIRTGGKWNKVIRFLNQLVDVDRHECKLPINFTVFKSNMHEIDAIIDLADKFNLDGVRLNLAQDWSENSNDVNYWTDSDLEYLAKYKSLFQGRSEWNYSDCFWPKRGIYMTSDGSIKTCCMNTSGISHGNILVSTLESIQKSESFQSIKNGCSSNKPTSHCKNCSYEHIKHYLKKIL